MSCIGDKVAGIDKTKECYRTGECGELGCEKCQIPCPGCENCEHLKDAVLRKPEVGDFVVVHQKLCGLNFKHSWVAAMDDAVGRIAFVAEGNPVDGFKLKFTTTNSEILDEFIFPAESLKLALPPDVKTDTMIKQVKEKPDDLNSGVI